MVKKRIYLPWLGEFGGQIEYFLYIKAYKEYKIVCHELGMDTLVPEADIRYTYPRFDEKLRKTSGSRNQYEILGKIVDWFGKGQEFEYVSAARYDGAKLGVPIKILPKNTEREYFIPDGREYNFDTDVVLFPRYKTHVGGKNWEHWSYIVGKLKAQGIRVFAAGTADMSYHLDCPCAWDYDNELDASIWAIKHSKLRVGPVTAGPLLSLLCGKSVWIVVHRSGNKCSPTGAAPARMKLFDRFDWLNVGWEKLPFMDLEEGWKMVVNQIIRELRS